MGTNNLRKGTILVSDNLRRFISHNGGRQYETAHSSQCATEGTADFEADFAAIFRLVCGTDRGGGGHNSLCPSLAKGLTPC